MELVYTESKQNLNNSKYLIVNNSFELIHNMPFNKYEELENFDKKLKDDVFLQQQFVKK